MRFRGARKLAQLLEVEIDAQFAARLGQALFGERHADARGQSFCQVLVEAARILAGRGRRHAERMPAQAGFYISRETSQCPGQLCHAQPGPGTGEVGYQVDVERLTHVDQWSDECVHAAYLGTPRTPSSHRSLRLQVRVNLLGDADGGLECTQ